MPRRPVPQPQRVLPFAPPVRVPQAPQTMPSHLKEAASAPDLLSVLPAALSSLPASRVTQWARASWKLAQLVSRRPYSAGIIEHHIDRLLAGQEAA